GDGPPQGGFVHVAAPGVGAEGDVAGCEHAHVQYGCVPGFIEDDRNLAASFLAAILEEDDVERRAADAVAVVVDGEDASELHGSTPSSPGVAGRGYSSSATYSSVCQVMPYCAS